MILASKPTPLKNVQAWEPIRGVSTFLIGVIIIATKTTSAISDLFYV